MVEAPLIHPFMATTTPLRAKAKGHAPKESVLSLATGFYFEHERKRYLITNRHVVIDELREAYPDHLIAQVHTSSTKPDPVRPITIPLYGSDRKPAWMEHPQNQKIERPEDRFDLVALAIDGLVLDTDYVVCWNKDRIKPTNVLLDVGDQVLVVGYPMFFYDEKRNLPIVKTGTVATPYKTIFQDKPVFLIDANLQEGASGSPVVTPQSNIQERGKEVVFGKYPPYLVGVNSAKYEALGLNVVWYASLILDIVTAR